MTRRVAKLHLRAQLREFFSSTPCAGHAILNCVAFDAQLDYIPPWDVEAKAGFNVCHPLYLVSKPWRNSASPRIRQLSFHRPRPIGKMEGKTKRATTVSWSESGQLSVSQPENLKLTGAYTRSILEASSPLGLTHVYTVLHGCICLQTSAKRCAEVNLSNSVIPASGLADTEAPSLSRPESGTQLKSPTMTHGHYQEQRKAAVKKFSSSRRPIGSIHIAKGDVTLWILEKNANQSCVSCRQTQSTSIEVQYWKMRLRLR
ncbi:hypothetical protein BSL78_01313 [Apostichopus japonicus]|uniref:Uncharacterized protein n=1 Tax=Stichopus japonicus TaxID=307972 RepID=A0A2G8LNC7_STIJA|nr:hypothetical protein BSL78_01313 [Apostichopus japonicus]